MSSKKLDFIVDKGILIEIAGAVIGTLLAFK
jgi:hypothetical protein